MRAKCKMQITIIYDNDIWKEGLTSSWGFSCLVEAYGKTILFDTGGSGSILLRNMALLKIKPTLIESVFISHAHGDHTGGLSDFLEKQPAEVYIPASCPRPIKARKVIMVTKPLRIHDDIFSTGELKKIEQSLVVKTEDGLVVITGCSHPGVKCILEAASQFGKVVALIGGLHGFNDFSLIRDLRLICPTHCTQHKAKIKSLYPEKYVQGGVGKIIEI